MWQSTLRAPICFSLLPFILTPMIIATPAPEPAPANGDPCGPAIQDNPNYPDTCSVAPVLVQSPQPYGINCSAIYTYSSHEQTVSWGNCSASIQDACMKLVDTRTRTAHWIWTDLAAGCALGFFLPPFPGSAPLPDMTRCVEIFTAMNDSCSTSVPASNYGGVNLATIPGFPPWTVNGQEFVTGYPPKEDETFLGNAVNVGYPSYAITWLPSTNPVA